MPMLTKMIVAVVAAGAVFATSAFAQGAKEVRSPSPFVAIETSPHQGSSWTLRFPGPWPEAPS